jgi:RNA polymerase sigma factor (sigma-70 family)
MRRREEMASWNILDLVQNARSGNLKSFNELVLMYQDMAYDIAYRMLNDQRAAGTATQKAFLSAYRSLSAYHGGSFRAWLLRILIQVCHNELRFHKTPSFTSIIKQLFSGTEGSKLLTKVSQPGKGNESTSECPDLNPEIQNSLAGLPADDRVILVLVDIWGMEYAEVAEITGSPTGVIRNRVALARKSLHDLLVVG